MNMYELQICADCPRVGLTVSVTRSDWCSAARCTASSSACWKQTLDFVLQAGITQFLQLPLIKTQLLRHRKEVVGRLTVHWRRCKCQSKERVAMERPLERHLRWVLRPCCLSLGACSFWSDWICLCYLILTLFLTRLLSFLEELLCSA